MDITIKSPRLLLEPKLEVVDIDVEYSIQGGGPREMVQKVPLSNRTRRIPKIVPHTSSSCLPNSEESGKSVKSKANISEGPAPEENDNDKNNLTCPTCSKKFNNFASARRHIEITHSDIRKWSCTLCPNKYKMKATLKNHINLFHSLVPIDRKPFKCAHCPNTFPKNSVLQMHIIKHHRIKHDNEQLPTPEQKQEPSIPCNYCPKTFVHKSSWKRHLRTIHLAADQRPFKCSICDRRFKYQYVLKSHVEIHNPDRVVKKFECGFCDKDFSRPGLLKGHVQKLHKKQFEEINQSHKEANGKEEVILGF